MSSLLGFYKVAELLIRKGADINAVNNRGYTTLIWAAERGKNIISMTI